jgi:hypothetical protein
MSYPRRHRWFRRMALGLAFASVIFAGRVSAATHPDEYFFDPAGLQATNDPYLSDVFVRPGESLGGPDGGPAMTSSAVASTSARDEVARPDGDQIAIEHELEALAQGGMPGYLNAEQRTKGMDRE